MKINIGKFRIFGKKLKRGKVSFEHHIIHTGREWMIGLSVTTILFVAGAGFFGYDFYRYLNGKAVENAEEPTVVEYRSADVKAILEKYREQKALFEKLRHEKSGYQAPQTTSPESVPPAEAPLAEEGSGQYSDVAPITDIIVQ